MSTPGDLSEIGGLYDCSKLARELGISRRAAEAIMRRIPKQHLPGFRKVFVRGVDVQKLLDENSVDVTVKAKLGRVA